MISIDIISILFCLFGKIFSLYSAGEQPEFICAILVLFPSNDHYKIWHDHFIINLFEKRYRFEDATSQLNLKKWNN